VTLAVGIRAARLVRWGDLRRRSIQNTGRGITAGERCDRALNEERARDVASALQESIGSVYGSVRVYVPADATRAKILRAFSLVRQGAKPNDVLIVCCGECAARIRIQERR
jgi:hypothetical protein